MTGDEAFLVGPTARTSAVWEKLQPYFREEAKKGVLDVDPKTPSSLTSHGPGYIDQDNEVIVGLQTDKPFRRAIMPTGGYKMVEDGLKASGFEPDPAVRETFTKYRKTHNDAVFDLYTPGIRACRKSGIITGLPDAYGRGRIIGDYRRVALYGVDRLLAAKKAERAQIDARWPSEAVMQLRMEMADQMRALADLKTMAASYGFDIGRPAANAREAVQWTYFGYLGAIKEMNGAAMSIGRVSTFFDIYIQRDLAEGTLTEAEAQEIIDQFVIKLRIVRFCAHRPTTRSSRATPTGRPKRRRDDARRAHTRDPLQLPDVAHAQESRPRAGAKPLDSLVEESAGRVQALLHRHQHRVLGAAV
jgi:formate C-acetyltransferase